MAKITERERITIISCITDRIERNNRIDINIRQLNLEKERAELVNSLIEENEYFLNLIEKVRKI